METRKRFDESILGRTHEDIDAMDQSERVNARTDDINRAIDLLTEISRAYDGMKGWGTYRKVAVLLVDRGSNPRMISTRARGVQSIVSMADRLNVGKGIRSAFARALTEATQAAKEMQP